MLKTITQALLVGIFLSVSSGTMKACSCGAPGQILKLRLSQGLVDPVYKDFATNYQGAIFVGRVTERKKLKLRDLDWYEYRVTFEVERYWKGVENSKMVVFTGIGGGDCGIKFKKGENYIVFANFLNGRWQTGICSLTMEGKFAPNVVKGLFLGEGEVPGPISSEPKLKPDY